MLLAYPIILDTSISFLFGKPMANLLNGLEEFTICISVFELYTTFQCCGYSKVIPLNVNVDQDVILCTVVKLYFIITLKITIEEIVVNVIQRGISIIIDFIFKYNIVL
jgi:hypothetical protein